MRRGAASAAGAYVGLLRGRNIGKSVQSRLRGLQVGLPLSILVRHKELMVVSLLLVIVAILLFGAAAVRGVLKGAVIWGAATVALLFVIGFAKTHYDAWSAEKQRDADKVSAQHLTLEAVASHIQKPQASLLDVVAYDADDDFEMCGTIAGTKGFGGNDGRQRWISNGGGRFEFERSGDKANFDSRVKLLCTYDHTTATMGE